MNRHDGICFGLEQWLKWPGQGRGSGDGGVDWVGNLAHHFSSTAGGSNRKAGGRDPLAPLTLTTGSWTGGEFFDPKKTYDYTPMSTATFSFVGYMQQCTFRQRDRGQYWLPTQAFALRALRALRCVHCVRLKTGLN